MEFSQLRRYTSNFFFIYLSKEKYGRYLHLSSIMTVNSGQQRRHKSDATGFQRKTIIECVPFFVLNGFFEPLTLIPPLIFVLTMLSAFYVYPI